MSMVQLGLHSNCCNKCDFCLIEDAKDFSIDQILNEIETAKKNIDIIANSSENWTNKFADGISVLGGEIFFIKNNKYKAAVLSLIDDIIEKILKVSPNKNCKFSTVTNGMYDPEWLLFPVIDKISQAVGLSAVDVNFSYDFKYRFHSEYSRKLCESTINKFHQKYNYKCCVQMILTQYVINMYLDGWRTHDFIDKVLPGNVISFLYPHPIHRGKTFNKNLCLKDFNFSRSSFFKFINILKAEEPEIFESFLYSTRNSATYKYTMLYNKLGSDYSQLPILSNGKEILNTCNHSVLYKCYSDSEKCMLCDLEECV